MNPQLHNNNLFNSSGCLTLSALEQYRDKQLGSKEQERVKKHLEKCEMCSDALEGLGLFPVGTSASPSIREVNARLRKRYRYSPTGAHAENKGSRINQLIIPAAASIILLAGIIGYFHYFLPKTQELTVAKTEEIISPTQKEKEIASELQSVTQQASKKDVKEEENTDEAFADETAIPPPIVVGGIPGEDSKQAKEGALADQDVIILAEVHEDVTTKETTYDESDDEILAMTEEEISIEAPSVSMNDEEQGMMLQESMAGTKSDQKMGKSVAKAKRYTEEEVLDGDPIFTVVEEMPTFPGGEDSLFQFIQTNFKFPVDSSGQSEGKTYVSFIVGPDGSISEAKILRGTWDAFNKEAVRVVEMMPAWTPGKQRGEPVAVQITLPIRR